MNRVSVIIPVYNSEKTIIKCLESVMAQTFQDFNVIIINDGSTDHSLTIIRNYVAQNNFQSKIHIINRSNNGVSSARNSGVDQADAELIVFVDSDDTVQNDHLQSLVRANDNADHPALVCNRLQDEHHRVKNIYFSGNSDNPSFLEAYVALEKSNQLGYLHNKIFNKNIITTHELRFPEKINMAEDLIFTLRYLNYTKKIYIDKASTYTYNLSENSLSEKKLDQHALLDYLSVLDETYTTLAKSHAADPEMVKWLTSFYITKKITTLMSIYIFLVVTNKPGRENIKEKIAGSLSIPEMKLLKKVNLIKYIILSLPSFVSSTIVKKIYSNRY